MATIVQDGTSRLVRGLAAAVQRFAERLERPAMPSRALEPRKPSEDADERIRERRHQIFVRYY